MARSIETIHEEILTNIENNPVLSDLNSVSKVAIFRLFAYIIAIAIHFHEVIFDTHKAEIDTEIINQKNAKPEWYRTMALRFQYGFDLLPDQDVFDNTGADDETIEDSKIIKYAAVDEADDEKRMIIKIAREVNDELAPLTDDQLDAFRAYVKEFKPGGIPVTIVNYVPDLLYLNLQIERDPLVLDANGMSILNGNYPVNEAIQAYMKLLPFNGEFVEFDFLKYIEANAEGVITPTAVNIESAFINPTTNEYGDPVSIAVKTIPFSGYFKVVNFDNISYVV